jgi:tetratricopeptide (TPR) repeat protein
MARLDWYRKTTWEQADREDFAAHLTRARAASRAQYLRIQALHLQQVGLFKEALGLLDAMLEQYPQRIELAQAQLQRAQCLAGLGRIPEATDEYRTVLRTEAAFPNVQTYAWIDFPWFAVKHHATHLYDEVLGVLGRSDRSALFPVDRYRINAILSLIAEDQGDRHAAREYARSALAASAETHSGFRYHSNLGLVRGPDPEIHERLVALAG